MTNDELIAQWYQSHLRSLNAIHEKLIQKSNEGDKLPVRFCINCGKGMLPYNFKGKFSKLVKYCGCIPTGLENKRRWLNTEANVDEIIREVIAKRKKRTKITEKLSEDIQKEDRGV
jgi:hypothetical protein